MRQGGRGQEAFWRILVVDLHASRIDLADQAAICVVAHAAGKAGAAADVRARIDRPAQAVVGDLAAHAIAAAARAQLADAFAADAAIEVAVIAPVAGIFRLGTVDEAPQQVVFQGRGLIQCALVRTLLPHQFTQGVVVVLPPARIRIDHLLLASADVIFYGDDVLHRVAGLDQVAERVVLVRQLGAQGIRHAYQLAIDILFFQALLPVVVLVGDCQSLVENDVFRRIHGAARAELHAAVLAQRITGIHAYDTPQRIVDIHAHAVVAAAAAARRLRIEEVRLGTEYRHALRVIVGILYDQASRAARLGGAIVGFGDGTHLAPGAVHVHARKRPVLRVGAVARLDVDKADCLGGPFGTRRCRAVRAVRTGVGNLAVR